MKGRILLISGPSGSGKSTLLNRLLQEEKDLYFSISSTTRAIREGEIDGVNYYFIDKAEFERGIKEGEFLEWACVHGNYYGTSLKPVTKALNEGKTAIFDIDVQGFKIARQKIGELITSIFITTPTRSELKNRLKNRGTDSDDVIQKRLKNALDEMECISEYDYILINDDIEESYRNLKAILRATRLKSQNINLDKIIQKWREI